jgi:hypothetical protein
VAQGARNALEVLHSSSYRPSGAALQKAFFVAQEKGKKVEDDMTKRVRGKYNVIARRRNVAVVRRASMRTSELERRQYIDLAYRLVGCTTLEEQNRLKAEIVRYVLRRRDA